MFEIIKKEKVVSFEDEILPPCWIYKDLKELNKENNYFKETKISKNIWVSGKDEKLLNELKVSIDNAKEMICLTSYVFSEPDIKECLLNASKRGVRVYMLTASNKHLKTQPDEDDEFNKKMYKEMDKLFMELQGKIKIRTSENFHTKLLLIDPPKQEMSKGYILTSNIDTKGLKGRELNGVFKVNPEICIELSKHEIAGFFNQFCYGFWTESMEESKIDGFLPITKRIEKNYNFKNILLNSKRYHSLENAILDLISKNPGTLFICTFGITEDNQVFKMILNELKKGREINILTRPRNKNMPALIKLIKQGANVYGHDDIHAKVFLIEDNDDLNGILLTANIEEISFDASFESGKILNKEEAKEVLRILNRWILNFPLELKLGLEKDKIKEKVRIWNDYKKEIERKRVINEESINLPLLKANSIEDYENLEKPEKEFKRPNEENNIYKKLIFTYEIRPPTLPNNAISIQETNLFDITDKKILKKSKLPIFELDKKYFIVIEDKNEIKGAKIIAEKLNAKIVTLEKYLINN